MDYDYEGDEDFGGRILWPRVGVFVLAAILILFLGRCTVGGGGADEGELTAALAANSEAQVSLTERDTTIAGLQQELLDARAQGGGTTTTPGGAAGTPTTPGSEGTVPSPGASGGAPAGTNPGSYVVQPGDTLSTIAEEVYGDPRAFAPIAEANGLTAETPIQEGQTLVIPDNPDAGQ